MHAGRAALINLMWLPKIGQHHDVLMRRLQRPSSENYREFSSIYIRESPMHFRVGTLRSKYVGEGFALRGRIRHQRQGGSCQIVQAALGSSRGRFACRISNLPTILILGQSSLLSVRAHSMFQRKAAESGDAWEELMELRCRRQVIERWLASCSLPDSLQQYLYAMLREIDDQLPRLTKQLGMRRGKRL